MLQKGRILFDETNKLHAIKRLVKKSAAIFFNRSAERRNIICHGFIILTISINDSFFTRES